jgi:hypothetical protein
VFIVHPHGCCWRMNRTGWDPIGCPSYLRRRSVSAVAFRESGLTLRILSRYKEKPEGGCCVTKPHTLQTIMRFLLRSRELSYSRASRPLLLRRPSDLLQRHTSHSSQNPASDPESLGWSVKDCLFTAVALSIGLYSAHGSSQWYRLSSMSDGFLGFYQLLYPTLEQPARRGEAIIG